MKSRCRRPECRVRSLEILSPNRSSRILNPSPADHYPAARNPIPIFQRLLENPTNPYPEFPNLTRKFHVRPMNSPECRMSSRRPLILEKAFR